ncbi:MAG: biotin--[Bacteroidales bacterium]|nr:biotin--[acetyl-CoA-carboxylase] ligase [Bacteroidales bacterium]
MDLFNVIELPQAVSTQTVLTEQDGRQPLDEFTVIYTCNQTGGRGQGSNVWESEKGKNISFSLLLRPQFIAPSDQYILTQMASLGVYSSLVKYVPQGVKIKWPNDVYVGQKKICGMLIQNKIIGNELSAVYIGIGLNVNQMEFTLAPNPTSLKLLTGRTFDLKTVLNEVLDNILFRYNQIKTMPHESIKQEYLSHLLFKDEWREYLYKGKRIKAKIVSVNSFGHIVFEQPDGTAGTCELKQWQFIF